jgi:hypothetical protein
VDELKVGANVMFELVNVRAVRVDTLEAARLTVTEYLVVEPLAAYPSMYKTVAPTIRDMGISNITPLTSG